MAELFVFSISSTNILGKACLQAARNMKAEDVEEHLAELFCQKGVPEYISSNNGSEFTSKRIRVAVEPGCSDNVH